MVLQSSILLSEERLTRFEHDLWAGGKSSTKEKPLTLVKMAQKRMSNSIDLLPSLGSNIKKRPKFNLQIRTWNRDQYYESLFRIFTIFNIFWLTKYLKFNQIWQSSQKSIKSLKSFKNHCQLHLKLAKKRNQEFSIFKKHKGTSNQWR